MIFPLLLLLGAGSLVYYELQLRAHPSTVSGSCCGAIATDAADLVRALGHMGLDHPDPLDTHLVAPVLIGPAARLSPHLSAAEWARRVNETHDLYAVRHGRVPALLRAAHPSEPPPPAPYELILHAGTVRTGLLPPGLPAPQRHFPAPQDLPRTLLAEAMLENARRSPADLLALVHDPSQHPGLLLGLSRHALSSGHHATAALLEQRARDLAPHSM
jgi:hypothetical protein